MRHQRIPEENRAEHCEGYRRDALKSGRKSTPEHLRSMVANKKAAAKTRAEALGRLMQVEGPDVSSGNRAPTPCRSKGITGRASRSSQAAATEADLQFGRRRVETRLRRSVEDGSR